MDEKLYKTGSNPNCPICLRNENVFLKYKKKFKLYFCKNCNIGFTSPSPKQIEKYYDNHYWITSSFVGTIKDYIFDIFQRRRINWLTSKVSKGNILDIGSGEARFGKALENRYKITSLEPLNSKVKNKLVIKKDFLKWETNLKFDAVTFWESLEHTPSPKEYLIKTYNLLNKNGFVFIEFPRYDSLELKIFKNNWFHLDMPRHLFHFTDKGIKKLVSEAGFINISFKSVPSFDYAPWGFIASILNAFKVSATDKTKQSGSILSLLLILPLFIISLPFEVILMILGQSPIGLIIAEKK